VITKKSTLRDVAFAVCTALAKRDLTVVLVGGSAATYYSGGGYQSYDADFVCIFYVDRERQGEVIRTMGSLGYRPRDNLFVHAVNPYTVDFPRGPIGIGSQLVTRWETIHRGTETLHIVTPTDCVCDRLAKYYFWNDLSALGAAKSVFQKVKSQVNLERVRAWSAAEGESQKFELFQSEISAHTKIKRKKRNQ
jgi:hypothetical protein